MLSDETKRKQYDQWGTTGDFGGSQGGFGGSQGGFQGFSGNIDPEELFRNIFQGFRTGFPESDYAESQYGFGSHEVNHYSLFHIIRYFKSQMSISADYSFFIIFFKCYILKNYFLATY